MESIKVVAAIIRKGNEIFAVSRGYGDFKGFWEFPGGKIENGETKQQALIREIKEELDINIQVNDILVSVEYDYPTFHLSMDCFECEISSGEIKLIEAESAKWLNAETIDSVQWLSADYKILPAIKVWLKSFK